MNSDKIAILQRALIREKAARKEAEKILEKKAAELYALTQELSETNTRLEKTIQQKADIITQKNYNNHLNRNR